MLKNAQIKAIIGTAGKWHTNTERDIGEKKLIELQGVFVQIILFAL